MSKRHRFEEEEDGDATSLRVAKLEADVRNLETDVKNIKTALAQASNGAPGEASLEDEASSSEGNSSSDEETWEQALQKVKQLVEERNELASKASEYPLGKDLCEAVENGNYEEFQRLICYDPNVNYTNANGYTLLHRALMNNTRNDVRLKVVNRLLDKGADPNAVSGVGSSALHLALLEFCEICLKLLINKKADVNARRLDGATPLHWAAQRGNEVAVRALLAAGARKDLKGWKDEDRKSIYENKTPFDVAKTDAISKLLGPVIPKTEPL